jgi:ABC-type bacteriocin/lantibiotic exporter with double-glycine peptidase domain
MKSFQQKNSILLGSISSILENRYTTSFDIHNYDQQCVILSYAMAAIGGSYQIVSSDGSFRDLLEDNNIAYREVKLDPLNLTTIGSVIIAFYSSDKRPAAIHRLNGRTVIFDGSSSKPYAYSGLSFDTYAFELYATLPSPITSPFQLLRFSFLRNIYPLLAVISASVIVGLLNLSIPLLTSFLTSTVLPIGSLRLILDTSLVVVLIVLCTLLSQYFSSLAIIRMESLVNLRLETGLWTHMLRLPLEFFRQFSAADLIDRVSSVSEMRQLFSNGLLRSSLGILFSIPNLFLMFYYQFNLAVIALFFCLLSITFVTVNVIRAVRIETTLQEAESRIAGMAFQSVVGLPQIRSSGSEVFVFGEWIREIISAAMLMRRSEAVTHTLEILSRVIDPFGQLLVFIGFVFFSSATAVPAVLSDNTAQYTSSYQLVASFVAFQAAYLSFNSQISNVSTQIANSLARLLVLWKRSMVVVHATVEPGSCNSSRLHALVGDFDIDKLVVRYPGHQIPVLSGVTLTIPKNSFTAVVGLSGCGKTTLMRSLLRLIEPDEGTIRVDGADLRELSIRNYRRQIGVVMQNAPLPSGSISEIILAGRSFDHNQIWDALEQVMLADDVYRLPMRLDTVITEGSMSISGGQRQRLALARALIGKPKVLFLDEATSSLDASTQSSITSKLDTMQMTRLIIAHRFSTIRNADQIAVLSNGVISELGSYGQLATKVGGYLDVRNRLK